MKLVKKLMAALCLMLMACLAVEAVLPAELAVVTSARAASAVKLNKTRATVYSGKTLKLNVSGTGKKVAWSSSDKSVAKVSGKGVVTAKKAGKATITARVGGKTLQCAVTVKPALSASVTRVTLKKGKSKKITLTWQLTGKVRYAYDNASVIQCSLGSFKNKKATLTVKALRPGTSTITLTNAKTDDVLKIVVTVPDSGASGPIVDKTDVSIKKGKTATVQVTWPYGSNPYPYAEFDPDMVAETWGDGNGSGWPLVIKGVNKGTTDIVIYKGKGGKKVATIHVTVN